MRKVLAGGIGGLLIAAFALVLWGFRAAPLKFDTAYQAVLLDNGQVYFGKVERLDREFLVLSEVYYIQSQADSRTKEVKNLLIRRGNEWHAPNRTTIERRHVVVIEPVTAGSRVAELIAALRDKP